MTSNLPDVVRDEPGREITTADVDSWITVASDVIRLANLIAPTEFVPASLRDSPPATAAAILYGREVGLPPMTALTQTHVIEGRPAMSAEAMRALVLAAGHDIEVLDTNRARCEIRGRRHGREKWTTVAVSIDEFGHLASKSNWRNYPRQMLQARATAELCRLAFPDVIHGFRATEEFDDLEDTGHELAKPASKTTVRRTARKTAAKKSAPAPLEKTERPALEGPPLPGEAGYEEPSAGDRPPGDGSGASTGSEDEPSAGGVSPAEAQTTDTASTVHEPVSEADEPPAGEGEGEAPEPAGDSEEATRPRGPRKGSRAQVRMVLAMLTEINGGTAMSDQDRHDIAAAICLRPVESYNDLTTGDLSKLIETLGRINTREELDALLAELSRAKAARWNKGDRS